MRFPDDVPTLTDATVTLRAHTTADLNGIVEQCNDPESVRWTTVPVPYGLEQASVWVGSDIPSGWRAERALSFAIEFKGRFAGSASLRPDHNGNAEIAYGLAAWARGHGVAKRAADLLLDWGFTECGFAVVHWRASVGNWASRRVAWASGFHFGPTIPRLLDHRGVRTDAWTGWITAEDARRPTTRWIEIPVLETGQIRLRSWRDDDSQRLVEASNDEQLRHFIPESRVPRTIDRVPGYLIHIGELAATGIRVAWCVADRDTDVGLGSVALFGIDGWDPTCGELGYWAHPDARGRGVVSTAVNRIVEWCFTPEDDGGFGLRRLHIMTAASNAAARRVAESAGFTHLGTERRSLPLGDGFDDTALYDRLRDDT
jgi:RimJ/RimL family protein N-acetyltransferase